MSFDIKYICAETHTPEYLMHKYWARKPHNVISECLKRYKKDNAILIDPFCGSGVSLREASLLNIKAYGFDINPVAFLISKTLTNPPATNEFSKTFDHLFNNIKNKYGCLYEYNGETIKFVSHRIIVKCDKCGKTIKLKDSLKNSKKSKCPNCGNRLHFNLENLVDTEVFNVCFENSKSNIDQKCLDYQKKMSNVNLDLSNNPYNFKFPSNKRILAYDGIETIDFFTNRNFKILTEFANEIWRIKDERIRDCLLVLLTGSIAQCSRLIASRNNLSTGGPAWSIPGFWIPAEHLETNPFVHITARYKKILKALRLLELKPGKAKVNVIKGDSLNLLKENLYKDIKADVIFLDPPYGDSVPYTEFSSIWNSFLKELPDFDKDISVTDRISKINSWTRYENSLNEYINALSNHLKKDGKLLITFNNNDMKAWYALIKSLQNNSFVCENVFYQIPAVISSKAQKAINSSYISDVYSTYAQNPNIKPSKDLKTILKRLVYITNIREGKVSKNILDREFIISCLENNMDCDILNEKDLLVRQLFDERPNNILELKKEYLSKTNLLKDLVIQKLEQLLKKGPILILDAYKEVGGQCSSIGTIELNEFIEYAKKDFIFDGNRIIASKNFQELSLI